MATRFLHGMKFFEQLWKPLTQGSILLSLVEIRKVVFTQEDFLSSLYNLYNTQTYTHTYKHTGEALYATVSQMLWWHKNIIK
jgi:hypothetical protein